MRLSVGSVAPTRLLGASLGESGSRVEARSQRKQSIMHDIA
jgi:hypothetical protein